MKIIALAACLLVPWAAATPMEYNPYTTNSGSTKLTHDSPVYGAVSTAVSTSAAAYEERSYEIPDVPDVVSSSTEASAKSDTISFSSRHITGSQASNDTVGTVSRKLDASSSTDVQKIEAHFGEKLETNLDNLPQKGAYHVMPWPSSYWPIYLDGINYRWESTGTLSPAAKYATAFDLDVDEFTKSVSESTGVLSQSSGTSCYSNWGCSSGSVCAKRDGEWQGYCIPTWYGICHAWCPASILEPEPSCAIEYNGVTFQPQDIKALLSQVYDDAGVGTVFTGARYNGDGSDTDQYGRYTDAAQRDLGPGFMHLALTNIIGRLNSTFVLDVTSSSQVWNQPIYSYEVTKQTEMTPSEAAQKYYSKQTYPFNEEAAKLMYTETTITWMVETLEDGGLVASGRAESYTSSGSYTYLLELDADDNILGGEWVGTSNQEHPDFLWFATGQPDLDTVTEVGLSYKNVRTLLDLATNCS